MDFLSYTVNPESDEPIMLIDRHIGYDPEDGMGIQGDMFQRELMYLDSLGKKRIQVWINSPGGIVLDGWNIYNAILRTTTKVDTVCIGMACSIAAVIFQAGRNRIMNDYGILMYHSPFGTDDTKALDAIHDSLVKMIEGRSGMSEVDVDRMLKRTTWIDAREALNLKLCDEIEASVDFNKKRAVPVAEADTATAKAFFKDTRKILNSIFNNSSSQKNSSDMKSIANKLNLNPEASEAGIMMEVDRIMNRNTSLEAKLDDVIEDKDKSMKAAKAELDEAKAKVKQLEDEMAKMKADAKAAKDAADAAETKNKENAAKEFVAEMVTGGKIKNDAEEIKKWEARAIRDLQDVKDILAVKTIEKKAETIENKNDPATSAKMTSVIAVTMGKLRNKLEKTA